MITINVSSAQRVTITDNENSAVLGRVVLHTLYRAASADADPFVVVAGPGTVEIVNPGDLDLLRFAEALPQVYVKMHRACEPTVKIT